MAIPVSGNQGYGSKPSITISVARRRSGEDGGRVELHDLLHQARVRHLRSSRVHEAPGVGGGSRVC